MPSNDTQLDDYYSLHPLRNYFIEKLVILQDTGERGLSVSIELGGMGREYPTIHLLFHTVRQLDVTLNRLEGSLEITSIKDRQWENLHYAVRGTKQTEHIFFYCGDFEFWLEEGPEEVS